MLRVSRRSTRNHRRLHFSSKSITTSNKRWWKSTYDETLQLLGSLMSLTKFRTNCFSMRKSSNKMAASWSSESAICHSRVCRNDGVNRNLDELKIRNKSIWSKYFAVLTARNKDMRQIDNWKSGYLDGLDEYSILIICHSILSLAFILSHNWMYLVLSSRSRAKLKSLECQKSAARAIKCKIAILCTPVAWLFLRDI
jgi:hypothetical protein